MNRRSQPDNQLLSRSNHILAEGIGEVEELSLKEYLIGTGGWAYFRVPGMSSLKAYSRVFDFVEVNSTFYEMPSLAEAERWRRTVPRDFHFAVRAHKSLTHSHTLQPTPQALRTLQRMKQICGVLNAEVLHLQTPPSFEASDAEVEGFRRLMSSTDLAGLRLALELRNTAAEAFPATLVDVMKEHSIVHCVDLSKGETPAYESDILYSRLFGRGKHNVYQPADEELAEIDRKASDSKSGKIMMSFHFVRMYKDAARLKVYRQTGKFPQVTHSTGLESLEEVLSEDTEFPAAKATLVDGQGWKLFDLTEEKRARAHDFLMRLPDRTYANMADVSSALRQVQEGT